MLQARLPLIVRSAMPGILLAQFAMAQMGLPRTITIMPSGGMTAMMPGPVVGSDGTAYALRVTITTTGTGKTATQTSKTELVAIHPQTGNVNWALEIDGSRISNPVLAGGNIYLTVSEPSPVFVITPMATGSSALVIVAPAASSAKVLNRVSIAADTLSEPAVTPDGQTIYVIAQSMPSMGLLMPIATPAMTGTLYGFSPAGVQKFKTPLLVTK